MSLLGFFELWQDTDQPLRYSLAVSECDGETGRVVCAAESGVKKVLTGALIDARDGFDEICKGDALIGHVFGIYPRGWTEKQLVNWRNGSGGSLDYQPVLY